MGIQKNLKSLFGRLGNPSPPAPALPPGLYHYDRQSPGERSRVHLRIDPDGSGLLLVNANRVMHLNPTAAFLAYLALEDTTAEQAVKRLRQHYAVPAEQALADYTQIQAQIAELVRPDGACPVHDLDLEIRPPFTARPSAPYRMDLALTYRCNNDCAHCYNARARTFPELTTARVEAKSSTASGRWASRTSFSPAASPPCAPTCPS